MSDAVAATHVQGEGQCGSQGQHHEEGRRVVPGMLQRGERTARHGKGVGREKTRGGEGHMSVKWCTHRIHLCTRAGECQCTTVITSTAGRGLVACCALLIGFGQSSPVAHIVISLLSQVAAKYPNIKYDELIVDNACMQLVRHCQLLSGGECVCMVCVCVCVVVVVGRFSVQQAPHTVRQSTVWQLTSATRMTERSAAHSHVLCVPSSISCTWHACPGQPHGLNACTHSVTCPSTIGLLSIHVCGALSAHRCATPPSLMCWSCPTCMATSSQICARASLVAWD
jgi:hypothetical protein